MMRPSLFPAAPRDNTVDRLHGEDIADPYRPLEHLDAPDTLRWVAAQAARSADFLRRLPGRDATEAFLLRASAYYTRGTPIRRGGRVFFGESDGKRAQFVLSVQDDPAAAPRVLIDPNPLSADGTIALGSYAVSHDGRHVAYTLSEAGSDTKTLRIRNTATGSDLPEVIDRSEHASVAWAADGESFLYNRSPQAHEVPDGQRRRYGRVLRHRIGTSPDADELVVDLGKPSEQFYPFELRRGAYEGLWLITGTQPENGLALRRAGSADFMPIVDRGVGDFTPLDIVADAGVETLYALTTIEAPRGRVVAVDLARPSSPGQWRTVIAEGEHVIEQATLAGDRIIVVRNIGIENRVDVHAHDGVHVATLALPGPVSANLGDNDVADPDVHIATNGYCNPSTIHSYDVASGEITRVWQAAPVADLSDATVEVVHASSRDGARIPMTIISPPGLERDGSHPVLMYGYGGFGVSLGPGFSTSILHWVRSGGIYVIAHLRGGGEFGQAWHDAGRLANKQNSFDDFIACGETLIAAGWTRPDRLAIKGGSNGGLLVTACMLQRPDLFGAVVAQVAVTDLLRFHKSPIGAYWVSDYGNPDDAADFQRLRRLSPLHNVAAGAKYPPILLTTGDHDDRVEPGHSFKLSATLQETAHPENIVLLRVDLRAGHGAGKPRGKAFAELADIDAFLAHALGLSRPERDAAP